MSHMKMYSDEELYREGSLLKKPIKTILDILPYFENYSELKVLDLGCGVESNCIEIARRYPEKCQIDCVDICYSIKENSYDFIVAVSVLEHMDTKESFIEKLREIKRGLREGGVVCLVINSSVVEQDKLTGEELPSQFEINLETDELKQILLYFFGYWRILKFTMQSQQYNVPREHGMSELKTRVVTLVARK